MQIVSLTAFEQGRQAFHARKAFEENPHPYSTDDWADWGNGWMSEASSQPPPGSDSAVRGGCTCARIDNCYGQGYRGMAGVFVTQAGCPLHGLHTWDQTRRQEVSHV